MKNLAAQSVDVLTAPESSRRAELEAIVEKHINGFREAGAALAEIRDSRLYRNTHPTFEDYCRGVWSIAASRARQLIGAAAIAAEVESVTTVTPTNEAQVRALNPLPKDERADAWKEAVDTAPGGKVTAAHVAKVVAERTHTFGTVRDGPEPTAADDDEPESDDFAEPKPGRAYVASAPLAALAAAEQEEAAKPKTWGGRTIPADAPPLNIDEQVRNDPGVRWTRIIRDIQDCIARLPDRDTLAQLPADRRRFVTDRFKEFAKQIREAV